jgi:MFS family permease
MRANPSVWTIMVALLGVHLAGMGAFLTAPVLAPLIAAETGLPASLAGLHTALCYAGAMVSGLFSARLLRRHGGVRVCQGGLCVIAAALALAALGTPWALALSALVAGMGHGPITPSGSHLLAPRTPARIRSLVFSLKQMGVPAGAMLVAAVAPVLALAFGWRVAFLCVAAFILCLALAMQPLRAALDADRDPRATGGSPLREAWASLGLIRQDRALLALTLASCGYGVAQFCFSSFFVTWQVKVQGRGIEEAGLLLALAQGAGAAGRVGWAVIADKRGARPVLLWLGIGAGAASLALALAGPGWPALLVALVGMAMGATAIGWNGVLLAETARVAPAGQVGAATAALGFAFGATMVVAPTLFSVFVALSGGYGLGFGMCAAAAFGGALAVGRLRWAPARP